VYVSCPQYVTRSGDGRVIAGAKTARVVKKHKEVSMIDDDDDDDDVSIGHRL
jgi:hypothetical protein